MDEKTFDIKTVDLDLIPIDDIAKAWQEKYKEYCDEVGDPDPQAFTLQFCNTTIAVALCQKLGLNAEQLDIILKNRPELNQKVQVVVLDLMKKLRDFFEDAKRHPIN